MLHVVLFQPEIPQNTGNVGRTCAATAVRLHLIHPLGFAITDRHLRRAGMDYWHALDLCEHADWQAFCASPAAPRRIWLFTTRAMRGLWEARFADGDGLLFGREGSGCPDWLHASVDDERRLRIPQRRRAARSLNLSTAVGVGLYEALRQVGTGAQ